MNKKTKKTHRIKKGKREEGGSVEENEGGGGRAGSGGGVGATEGGRGRLSACVISASEGDQPSAHDSPRKLEGI